jgi:hypothetical protein
LIQKLIVLVAEIFTNDNFLSQIQNPATPSLSSSKKKRLEKKEKNKVWC